MADALNLPSPCVVVLVGPGASGKSAWAAANFPPEAIVSSDRLRALIGAGEGDLTASSDAFALLEDVVRKRLARGLTTVIDTLGLDAGRRREWLALARRHQLACVAVAFDTPAGECRARNRDRAKRIPADVLSAQLARWPRTLEELTGEGYDAVLTPRPVRVVPRAFVEAPTAVRRHHEEPKGLRFGLHLGSFTFPGGSQATASRLRLIAEAAEAAGFDAIYVMDHFRQIPQVGRPWEDFLDSYTTLAYLAACTERVQLGALVTGITYRHVVQLAKIVATLDVLSGGRAVCGLGLAWFKEEHLAYGVRFPPTRERYALLEDALQLFPLMWGPGRRSFEGKLLTVPETACYPRPLQEHVPIILGGGGELRTLRLAARYADAANVLGDTATVWRKAAVLRAHCEEIRRDPAEVRLTHLSTALVGADDHQVVELVERLRPRRQDPARFARAVNAGTIGDHVGRFRELADAGVAEVMIRLPDVADPDALERTAKVIRAFR
ncbi:MAG: TIGR03560 family F420-dependent LLM class oxidoreductase [Candidatus Dormibacter sp.]|uniref:TIGR03560 family F420-dependent LLM class oxidoreductase n=1 Tax=Candidatus Dormibacter sp. TaxID=2973982 RepID=UPI000DB848C8|nr:MAG: luciferase [Candidatus Dormibacteraeota bacterium]